MIPRDPPLSSTTPFDLSVSQPHVARWTRRRSGGFGRLAASLALLGVLAACAAGSASASSSSTSVASEPPTVFTAAAPGTLESDIAQRMEGAQLEVRGGGLPAPGDTTTIMFHHGSWAAEVFWKSDGWCLARVYTWRVADAVSATSFRLDYLVTQEYTDCLMHSGHERVFDVTGFRAVRGAMTIDGHYDSAVTERAQRTVCGVDWNDPSPCGFAEAAALRPMPDA